MALRKLQQPTKLEVEPAMPLPAREGPLSVVEEHRLSRRWRTLADETALARLVHTHLGLVIRIATEFRHSGPSMEDLIQEGNLGLTIAARRFDPSRQTRLATYATYWIRACILEHVVRSHGPVRIGTTRSQRKIFFGLGRARRLLERTGRPVDAHSLAHEPASEAARWPRGARRARAHDHRSPPPAQPTGHPIGAGPALRRFARAGAPARAARQSQAASICKRLVSRTKPPVLRCRAALLESPTRLGYKVPARGPRRDKRWFPNRNHGSERREADETTG